MSSVLKLLRLQIDNKYDFFKKTKKKSFRSFGGYAIIMFLVFFLTYFLGGKITSFLTIQMDREFFTIVFFIVQSLALIFGMANVLKNLYMSKDNELLIVFPVTFNELYLSKILILYISELIFNLVYITPILIAIGTIGAQAGAVGFWYFFGVTIFIPLFPILPLAIAVIISIPIMYLIKFLRKYQVVSIILILLTVLAGFILYMSIVPKIHGAFNIADQIFATSAKINNKIGQIGSKIPIYHWFSDSFLKTTCMYRQAIYLGVAIIAFILATFIIKPFFKNIVLMGNEGTQIKGHKKPFKERKPFTELLITQFRLLFRSPNYVFEYLLFPILMPIITIAYDVILNGIEGNEMGTALIVASHVLVVAIIAFIGSAISSTAISRDGAMTYFIKSCPASYYKQTIVKIVFNVIITFASLFLTALLCLVLKISKPDINIPEPYVIILTMVSVFSVSIGHICHSYDMDLRNPTIKWYDSSEIQALNKNTAKTITLGLVLAVMMFFVMALLYHDLIIGFTILIICGLIYSAFRIYLLFYRINHYYQKMEI